MLWWHHRGYKCEERFPWHHKDEAMVAMWE
jgi:hypothetical protein